MAKSCPICKKGTIIGGHRSNRVRATKFNPTGKKRKYPNLQWAALPPGLPRGKAGKRIKICTDCLKKGRHLGM
ncbi:TPA: 50S ribosomal protein L28 [Candidatus Woesearchaeota archaeon]|nr:50S ribosomal protein L28 [Candidatus Woesearchaeota archaeon]